MPTIPSKSDGCGSFTLGRVKRRRAGPPGLSLDLDYNVMFSQRGVVNLAHSDPQMEAAARRGNSMRLNGIDAELLNREQVRAMIPHLDYENERFPIYGALVQPRGGTARHDAVAWGYARGADARVSWLTGLLVGRLEHSPIKATPASKGIYCGNRRR